ncbi:MAG: hypothetical protein WCZ01_01265 [Candidatus Neomarinimicrobiota bacterium]
MKIFTKSVRSVGITSRFVAITDVNAREADTLEEKTWLLILYL